MAPNFNNSNSSLDGDARYIEFIGDKLIDLTEKFESMSQTLKATIDLENKNRNRVINKLAMSSKEIDNAFKMAKGIAEKFGRTSAFNASIEGARASVQKLAASGKNIQEDRLLVYLENFLSKHISESSRAIERGEEPTLKKADAKAFKPIIDELDKKFGVKLTTFQDKILVFFSDIEKERDKKRKRMVDDLVEGLASNKFIGGALKDTVRLFGLLGAQWLSRHFGKLGQYLGGVLYGASEALSGVLGQAIVTGLTQGLAQIVAPMLAKAILSGFARIGGKIGSGGAIAIGSTVAGGAFIGSGIDSLAHGKKGNAAALIGGGVGTAVGGTVLGAGVTAAGAAGMAATMGATGVAGALGAIAATLNPIGATILAISLAVAGIAYLWKKFHKDAGNHFAESKKHREEEKRYWWEKLFQGSGNGGPGGDDDGDDPKPTKTTKSGSGAIILKGHTKKVRTPENKNKTVFDPTSMSKADWNAAKTRSPIFGKHGEILNLGTMTTKRAEKVLADRLAADKKAGIKSYYEVVPLQYVDPRSMKTAPLARDSKGRVIGAYAGLGTTALFKKEIAAAKKLGYNVSGLKMTGGILTLGDPDRGIYPESAYTGRGHGRTEGTTTDSYFIDPKGRVVTMGIKDRKKVFQTATGRRPGNNQIFAEHGNTIVHQEFGLTSEQEALGTVNKRIANATAHSIKPVAAAEKANAAAYNEIMKKYVWSRLDQGANLKDNEFIDIFMRKMKERGYTYNESKNQWVKPSNNNNKVSYLNPTGNSEYMEAQQTMNRTVMYGTNEIC